MSARKPRDKGYWEEELKYIQCRVQDNDLSSFNNSKEVFKKYVTMQYCHCADDGFLELAGQMLSATENFLTYTYRINFRDGKSVLHESKKHPIRHGPTQIVEEAGYDWEADGVDGVTDLRV